MGKDKLMKGLESSDMKTTVRSTMHNDGIRRAMLVVAVICCSLPVFGADRKHSADLEGVTGDVHVIFAYSEKPNDIHIQKILSAGGTADLQMDEVRVVAATIPAEALRELESDPAVNYISADRPVHGSLDYSSTAVGGNVAYQSGYTGAGIGIAIVDSGVNQHADLNTSNSLFPTSRIVYSQSFVSA